MNPARILIAEENHALAHFASSVFEELNMQSVILTNVTDLLKAYTDFTCFLVNVDLSGGAGLPSCREIWNRQPNARILFGAHRIAETCVRHALEFVPDQTVFGYIERSISRGELKNAANQVFKEEQCFLQLEVSNVLKRLQNPKLGLTPHEYEVLVDIAVGLTDKAIAERRYLSRRAGRPGRSEERGADGDPHRTRRESLAGV